MNDAQIIQALLDFYKSRGIDLHYVLDDPVFNKLPVQARVQAIKKHAQEIADGTSPGFSKIDRSTVLARAVRLGIQGGLVGSAAGSALGAVARGGHPAMPLILGAVTGGVAGVGSALIEAHSRGKEKHAIRNQLLATSHNPTDSNAIGALSIRDVYGRQTAAQEEIYSMLRDYANRAVGPEVIGGQVDNYLTRVEAAQQS